MEGRSALITGSPVQQGVLVLDFAHFIHFSIISNQIYQTLAFAFAFGSACCCYLLISLWTVASFNSALNALQYVTSHHVY